MKLFTMPLLAIVTAAVVVGMVTIGMQQAYAPRNCGGCAEFKKMTHEFEKNVINAIGDPNISPGPRELLNAYNEKVVALFYTDPWLDQVRPLLQSYTEEVTSIFDSQPPEPDNQQQHDQIKELKQLTKDFEGAIAGVIIAATADYNR